MSTVAPISQAPPPSDPAQFDAASNPNSATTVANPQNFAAALSDAGAKPAHRNVTAKTPASPNGGHLPLLGNPLPPVPTPLPPATPPAAPNTAPTVIAGSAAAPAAALLALPSDAPAGHVLPSVPSQEPDPVTATTDTTASGDSPGTPAVNRAPLPAAMTVPTIAATKAVAAVARGLRVPTIEPIDTAPIDNAAVLVANVAANSDASAPADSDKAAQGTIAVTDQVAGAAVAFTIAAPTAAFSSSDDLATAADLATPDTGVVSGISIAARANAAALTAVAASNAQSISALADAGAADKHARGSAPESSLSVNAGDGSAAAAQLLTNPPVSSATAMPTFKVAASVDSSEFGQGVATQVSLMMDGNFSSAKLQVNPPALGPIEVRIALQGGHAQVWFTSHSAATRDALEASAPKLREMLGSQGFGQVSVDISQRSFQERSAQSQSYKASPAVERGERTELSPIANSGPRVASGVLDAYA
jgi:flagellar hook-length control protein FliK